MEMITMIPGTEKRVKTTDRKNGQYCIELQQNARNLINPYPWEVQEDGWRTCKFEYTSSIFDAYATHDRYIVYEVRHQMMQKGE